MCGIFGLWTNLGSKQYQPAMMAMRQSLLHRGPDYQDMLFADKIALGHCRLKIIDLSEQANQPIANEDKSIYLVFNGEVYNFKKLRQELLKYGHSFVSQTDAEVVLHAYEQWDKDFLTYLEGMFAFCLYDTKKNLLLLARDRLGIKPCYYYFSKNLFIFASEVRAILAAGLVPKEIEARSVINYLSFGAVKDNLTIVRDIVALPAGHYLLFREGDIQLGRYWDLLDHTDLNWRQDQLRPLLEETVRRHLVSDVPVGVFLSGGIDSSSLVALAKTSTPSLRTISLVFRQKQYDESRYAQLIAAKFKTDHTTFTVDTSEIFENLADCLAAMDQPTFNGINTYFVSQVARRAGLVVILSGLGADELFLGYPSFRNIHRLLRLRRYYRALPLYLRQLARITIKNAFLDNSKKIKLLNFLETEDTHPYFILRRLFSSEEVARLIDREVFLNNKMDYSVEERLCKFDIVNQLSYLEMRHYMRDVLLRDTDFMSMWHSLEVRVPYLDHRLLEYVFSLPVQMKLNKRLPKPLLVETLKDELPSQIYRRPKQGFVLPFGFWLKGGLKSKVEEVLFLDLPSVSRYLNPIEVKRLWKGFLRGKVSWQRIWAIYVFKAWILKHL